MLHKGMGRAVLYLLSQDLSQYREMILDCCLHHYAYDRQLEDARADYLHPLIKQSGEEDFYRTEILNALPTTEDCNDAEQLLDFAVIFARDGDERAKEAIYEKLRRGVSEQDMPGADQAVALDGADGLVRVLDVVGATGHVWNDLAALRIEQAVEMSGADAVRLAVREAAANNPNIVRALAAAGYTPEHVLEEVEQWREKSRAQMGRRSIPENTTWEEIKNSPDLQIIASRWAMVASDEELAKAARDLDPQEEPKRLQWHLRIFWKRAFPLDPEPIIGLVDHPDERVASAAINVLRNVQDDAVRALFDRLRVNSEWSDWAVSLLRSNYRGGDEAIIAKMLEGETDPEKLHRIAIDAAEVYKDNPVPEGVQVILFAYEKTPCSLCRHRCLEALDTLGSVPDWMIEECLHDAYEPTRELAARLSGITCSEPPW